MTSSREINARIAAGYDLHPWSQRFPEATDPAALQLLAQCYGGDGRFGDVLDLGCGTGALLASAGQRSKGRLVGTDISARSCERARAALARFDGRAEIVHADVLDLKPESLGEFDLIYCTGVIYVVPPDVRQRILELIGQCLRPGGAALISYYAGLGAAVRAHLAAILRASAATSSDPSDRTRIGRETLDLLRSSLGRRSEFRTALRAAFRHFDRSNDEYFFAESLSGDFEPISTSELDRSLEPYQIGFATYLGFTGFDPAYSATDRALMADRLDLTDGAYRYALFVKQGGKPVTAGSKLPGPDSYPAIAGGSRNARSFPRRLLRRIFSRLLDR